MSPNQNHAADGGLLTIEESAQYLRISRSKLYQLMDTGGISFVKIDKCRRIMRRDLDELIERLRSNPAPAVATA
jgi:excisionase family DNA binding protein